MTECCCDDIIIEVNEEGVDGVGIASIELVSTVGITKNYRINLTNGTHFYYSISDGSSIASISKTSSAGLVDTYTVTLTSGETSTFEVTNGNGIASITKTSTDNLTDTYTISYTNGTTSTFSVTNGNSIASVSKVSTQVLTDTYKITYTDEDKSPDSFTVVNGRGITSIAKTSTSGLVDTYTITYNDSSTSTFTVTNGEKGDKGDTGDTGNGIVSITLLSESGLIKTYRITMTDGTHFDFDVTDGEKGDTGETGATGNGIASIEKTATVGLVDTYTITMTDGTTTTFDVTNGSDEWGAITGTLSDQTDLQNALDSKAPAITETASGSIASFTDGSTLPVEDLTVAIEPVQDLHGYDNPWPAGGGKNLADLSAFVQGSIYPNDGSEYASTTRIRSPYIAVNSGNYTVSVPSGYNIVIDAFDSNKSFLSDESLPGWSSNNTRTITVTNAKYLRILIRKSNDSTITPSTVSYVQLESGSSATSIVPYENICPISGRTSATVTRTGKNLLPDYSNLIINIGMSNQIFSDNGIGKGAIIKVKPNTAYTVSGNISDSNTDHILRYGEFSTYPKNGDTVMNYVSSNSSRTFTTRNTSHWLVVWFTSAVSGYSVQLELGSSATTYEAPQIQTVTIDLDGTRYGGTLNVLTGTMTVDRQMVTFDGSESWSVSNTGTANWYYKVASGITPKSGASDLFKSNLYPFASIGNSNTNQGFGVQSNGEIRVRFGTEDALENWKAYLSTQNLQVIIPLASSVTVQLTPSQMMQTLLGQNVFFADTGDVAVTYRADTKLYIQEQIAKSETLTRKMIADSANGDLAPKTLAVDELVIVGDELRKATESIGQGSAITSLNSTTANLADVIKALQ